ncbi:MAG: M20/M25/M40 family metallo-hydrolase [Clostridia bacterium]|nr:M20/M25/M40 family metallo-hydrolase [Clostridia bacterium]
MIVLWILLAAVVVLLAVVLVRALAFRPKPSVAVQENAVTFDRDRAVENLRRLVQCKTISYKDASLEDDAEFEKLLSLLPELFPQVYATCTVDKLADRGLLFRWKGKASDAPAVMMAHYDVVPVNEDMWDKPPFDGVIEDGVLWGRGTLDTKVTFSSVLTAAEHLIGEGFVPEQDMYFAFSGGEEVNGLGAVHIVDYFESQGITPSLVIDEGGAVVEDVFPGVKAPCGMIGIAEKGIMDVRYTALSSGGHASAPKPKMPVDTLARACARLLDHPFKLRIAPPAAQMFDTLGRHSNFLYRMIFANLWLFSPVLDMLCKKSGGDLNALLRTTVAFTQMSGSSASNVIPPKATMVSNIRLNPLETMATAKAYIEKTIADDSVQVDILYGTDPSRISRTDCDGWNRVATAVASTWRGCIVTPYLMMQASDSRHYGRISDRVYRFSAMDLTREERASIHGNNERIRLDCLCRAVEFYIRLMSQC